MTTAGTAPSGTLQDVLAAFESGVGTTAGIGRATGLDRGLVELALDQLEGLGLVTRQRVSAACPEGGCTGCPAPTGHGCSAPRPGSSGLVTLSLTRRLP